jgi:NMD protein affecting ribosome stability and mRNA decay
MDETTLVADIPDTACAWCGQPTNEAPHRPGICQDCFENEVGPID